MGYIHDTRGNEDVVARKVFTADSSADLTTIAAEVPNLGLGDVVWCLADSSLYAYNSQKQWVKQ